MHTLNLAEMADLSPAAQAVLDAAKKAYWLWDQMCPAEAEDIAAAALRAAADKLSQEVDAPKVDGMKYAGIWHSFDYLLAIAAELESFNG